jgi:UDP-N-acetyl-D-glucosamine dehydrogenase
MTHASELREKFASRSATVGVIGLGYVGLPLACTIAEAGLRALGFDVDGGKIEKLARGESYIRHIPHDRILKAVSGSSTGSGRLLPAGDFAQLRECDGILICVPTPLTEGREPDLSYVRGTAETVAANLRRGQLVVLESTTYPGTTEEVLQPILERGGLKVGRDFHLAFSPEREEPGNRRFSTRTIPKIVGGVTPECGEVAAALYRSFIETVVPVSSARIAESAKLLENIYRSINIALVNELKMLFDRMDIDVWEVIAAAATKPFGFTPFFPGPGLGGHCIPIDPFYLTWKARHYDFSTRFIELAGEINTLMPYYVVDRVVAALGERGRAIRDARILVLGVAYKKDVDDLRESPSLKVIEILESRGSLVSYNDPYVSSLRARRLRHYDTFELDSVPLTDETLASADCVLVATDHSEYDYDRVVRSSQLVVDTRNATHAVKSGREKIVKA